LQGYVQFDEKGTRKFEKIAILQYRVNSTTKELEAREIATIGNCEASLLSADISNNECVFHYVNEENNDTVWTGE